MKKTVRLLQGDITSLEVDALVNSANKSLLGGGGLDYIVHKKAGNLMKEACIHLNKTKGGCKIGQVEITVAGNLPAKYVIHAVAPRWLDGERGEPYLLYEAYHNSLKEADSIKAKIISFPNMGTGVYKFPKTKAAEIAIGTILLNLSSTKYVQEVLFVCRDDENYQIYSNILKSLDDPLINIVI